MSFSLLAARPLNGALNVQEDGIPTFGDPEGILKSS
jgi:hypothetical protein